MSKKRDLPPFKWKKGKDRNICFIFKDMSHKKVNREINFQYKQEDIKKPEIMAVLLMAKSFRRVLLDNLQLYWIMFDVREEGDPSE